MPARGALSGRGGGTETGGAWAELVEETRVRTEIYTDPAVFGQEMQRIFGRAWVYIGHDSEVAEAGDYKTTTIGRVPIVISRGEDGELHVLLNRCRHRGATVCQREQGNARHFRCSYHGWTYRSDGQLIGVPFPSGYPESFDRDEMSLVRVPRVDSYRGFLFASLDLEVVPLEDYLGSARQLIDEFCAPSPEGRIALTAGAQRYGFDGNWKLQMENGVDGYHPNFVHRSFAVALTSKFGAQGKEMFERLYNDQAPTLSLDLGNGHGVLDQRAFGPVAADERAGGGFNLTIFPNLLLIGAQVRTIRPIRWDRTEVSVQVVVYPGLEDLTESRLRTHEWFYGPAGFGQPDDAEMFRRVTAGFEATPVQWVDFGRGTHRELAENGVRIGHMVDEVPQRGFYRMWRRLMAGESPSALGSIDMASERLVDMWMRAAPSRDKGAGGAEDHES
jgi:phenylpropionate dioxygenase-like ring-hydroxylating dioxygenase large terminal subunit